MRPPRLLTNNLQPLHPWRSESFPTIAGWTPRSAWRRRVICRRERHASSLSFPRLPAARRNPNPSVSGTAFNTVIVLKQMGSTREWLLPKPRLFSTLSDLRLRPPRLRARRTADKPRRSSTASDKSASKSAALLETRSGPRTDSPRNNLPHHIVHATAATPSKNVR